MIKISKIFGDFVPRDPAFARVFSRRSAILKIVEEKALGTRLLVLRIEQSRLRQDFFLREQVCINTEIFGIVNAVGFLLKPELASVSMVIISLG